MTLYQARRNQSIIAGVSTVLLVVLWTIGDLPRSMYFALPFVIAALWVTVLMVRRQFEGSLRWNTFFGLLGVAVGLIVVRVVWLIGRG